MGLNSMNNEHQLSDIVGMMAISDKTSIIFRKPAMSLISKGERFQIFDRKVTYNSNNDFIGE